MLAEWSIELVVVLAVAAFAFCASILCLLMTYYTARGMIQLLNLAIDTQRHSALAAHNAKAANERLDKIEDQTAECP